MDVHSLYKRICLTRDLQRQRTSLCYPVRTTPTRMRKIINFPPRVLFGIHTTLPTIFPTHIFHSLCVHRRATRKLQEKVSMEFDMSLMRNQRKQIAIRGRNADYWFVGHRVWLMSAVGLHILCMTTR